MFAPSFLLAEVAGVVRRQTGRESDARLFVTALQQFSRLTIVQVSPALMVETVTVAGRYALKGSDAMFVATAGMLGLPLVTFDREQLTRPLGYIATVAP